MHRLRVLAGQILSLGVVLGALYRGWLSPRILAFAFILATAARLLTVYVMRRLGPWGAPGLARFLQASFFRLPPRGVPPPYYTDADTGKPVGPWAYVYVAGIVMGMAFLLLHVDSYQTFHFSWPLFFAEISQASGLALVYWLSDLFARDMVFDPRRPDIDNLAYNNTSLTILAVATLASAAMVPFVGRGHSPQPWRFYGPVLALVHLTGLWRGLRSRPDR